VALQRAPVLNELDVGASKAVPIEIRRPRYCPRRVVMARGR